MNANIPSQQLGIRSAYTSTRYPPTKPDASAPDRYTQTSSDLADIAPPVRADLASLRTIVEQLHSRVVIQAPQHEFIVILSGGRAAHNKGPFISTQSTPLIDPCGQEVGTLEIQVNGQPYAQHTDGVLTSILAAAQLAVAERWFRFYHRRRCIIAARRVELDSAHCVLLALNSARRVVGLSRGTDGRIGYCAVPDDTPLTVSAFFGCGPRNFPASQRDQFIRLSANDGKEPWDAVMTPADVGLTERLDSEKIVLHTRPRLHLVDSYRHQTRPVRPISGLPPRVLRHVQARIDAELDADLTLTTLANWTGMSVSHFTRSFLVSVGVPPHLYIMRRRLVKAQAYLLNSDLPLSQIALATGFADQSHFSRRFHRETGMPPLRYRLLHRSPSDAQTPVT
jgi:AraC-like DNA-binding protein